MSIYTSQIQQLYVAYFGRPADADGLAFWELQAANSGGSASTFAAISASFATSAEYLATYAGLTAYQKIDAVYTNLLHRTADDIGRAYWGDKLALGALTIDNFVTEILKSALQGPNAADKATVQSKIDASVAFTAALVTPEQKSAYTASAANASEVAWLAGIYDATTEAAAIAPATLNTTIANLVSLHDTYTLTSVPYTGPAHNVFLAPLVSNGAGSSIVNSLQNGDILTGRGVNPTLTATLGAYDVLGLSGVGNSVQPTLNGIQTINVNFNGSFSAGSGAFLTPGSVTKLDLQNATGVQTVNITGITDPHNSVSVTNFTAVPTNLSVANTSSPAGSVTFATLDAAAKSATDVTKLTVTNVNVGTLNLNSGTGNGIETVNLVSAGSGANTLGSFNDSDITTLNISGAADLKIGSIGYNNQGKFITVDGSTATGNLNLTLDSLQGAATATKYGTTGGDVLFTVKTGSGADTINSTINFGNGNDIVDAGSAPLGGVDTLALSSTHTQSFTDFATYKNFEAVTVTRTDGGSGYAILTVDSKNVTGDQTFSLVNQTDTASAPTEYDLNNLSAVEAIQITIAHSGLQATSSANNDGLLGNNLIVANLATQTTNDTVGVTVIDGLNTEPRFNFQLSAPGAENIIITDSDTESNTVLLNNFADHTGTITLTGGVATQFLNLDASANGYGLDVSGLAVDLKNIVSKAGNLDPVVSGVYSGDYRTTYNATGGGELLTAANIIGTGEKSDVIVRVVGTNLVGGVALGGQNIQLGSGNDTVIFANRSSFKDTIHTSGLTIADTVSGGTGQDTIILDGSGYQQLGADEWTNLTGIDVLRLAGAPGSTYQLNAANVEGFYSTNGYDGHTFSGGSGGSGGSGYYTGGSGTGGSTGEVSGTGYSSSLSLPGSGAINLASGSGSGVVYTGHGVVYTPGTLGATTSTTPFVIKITNEFVAQTDAHNNLTIINNDGNLASGNENTATINLRELNAAHNVVFDGPNGNKWDFYSGSGTVRHAQQIVQVSDASSNGLNKLDGGNPDFTYYGTGKATGLTQSASNIEWNATRFIDGSNNNIYQVWNTAEVTAADLANTKNFDTIEFRTDKTGSASAPQTLALTLTDTVLHNLVQPLRTASAAAPDRLWIQAVNSYDSSAADVTGYAQLNIDASQLTSKSDLVVYASGDADIIRAGGGNDVIYAFDPVNGDGIGKNLGGALINGGGGEDYIYLGVHKNADTINVDTVDNIVHLFGFDASGSIGLDVINISADSTVYLETHNTISGGGIINVTDGTVAIDSIFQADHLNIHGGVTTLTNSWSQYILIDASSTLNLGLHNSPDIIAITGGSSVFLNDSYRDVLNVTGGTTVLGSTPTHSIGLDLIHFTAGTASVDLGTHSFGVDTITVSTVSGSGTDATILHTYGSGETITVNPGTTSHISGDFGSWTSGTATTGHLIVAVDSVAASAGTDTILLTHTASSLGGTTIQSGIANLSGNADHIIDVTGAIIGANPNYDTFDLTALSTVSLSITMQGGNVIPGTTGFAVNVDGVITLSGTPTGTLLDTAHRILNDLEVSTFANVVGTTVTKVLTTSHDFVYNDNAGGAWVFEIGDANTGQIIHLVGITNVDGFNYTTPTTGNQVHVI